MSMENLTEKLVQSVMDELHKFRGLRQFGTDNIKSSVHTAIRSVLGQEWVTDEQIEAKAENKYPDYLQQEAFRKGAKWMRKQISTPPTT